jgi:hypothetical protein
MTTTARALQPLLHDLVTCFQAPTAALSAPDGQIRRHGAQGLLHADVRVLTQAVLTVDGREPEPIAAAAGAGEATFTALARWLGDDGPDPTVRLDRRRTVTAGGLDERIALVSTATGRVTARVELSVRADLADVETIKEGGRADCVPIAVVGQRAGWGSPGLRVTAEFPQAGLRLEDGGTAMLVTWDVELGPRAECVLGWGLTVADVGAAVLAAPGPTRPRPALSASADDRRLGPWLARSLDDLAGLRMVTRDRPDDVFLAAGVPWYQTLFGRDSIWAARLLLPTGTDLAAGTLRTLAALQGTRHDDETGEAPGKIPHELRRVPTGMGAPLLPPLYYGTVDATPLWVCLLHDAWRWGLPAAQVRELLPHAERALDWMATDGDGDRDGFLEYTDGSGSGLTNQGWKDSGDAVRFADGSLAVGPVALCEVQGYAHEAALGGAALLEAFGRPGARRWRGWAAELRERFRERFWVGAGPDRRPALALDGAKRAVDSTTSNIGHLLGTGLLDPNEEARVAARVVRPDLDGGLGLRTMSAADGGYAPLSYHCGSVWPHDTAIVVAGLVRSGHGRLAGGLVEGLLAASAAWDGRLPELWSGQTGPMVPYPASCRPQAWSAAAAVAVVQAVLGIAPDLPAGVVRLAVPPIGGLGRLAVKGLALGDESVTIRTDGDGGVVEVSGTTLNVQVG